MFPVQYLNPEGVRTPIDDTSISVIRHKTSRLAQLPLTAAGCNPERISPYDAQLPSPFRRMRDGCSGMIAYLILVHRYPEQFKRMFKAIYDPKNLYVVHVDKNSGPGLADDIQNFLKIYPNTDLLPAKKALWGGYSLVDAELRGMKRLLEMGKTWTHFINLSGQDFPLKTQAEISTYLKKNPDREFIKILDQKRDRPDTMPRIGKFVIEVMNKIVHTTISRPFMRGVRPFIGNQWMIVSRGFCEFVCHDWRANRFKAFYRNTFIADEGFFQTVMMNTLNHGMIVRDDLRLIDWVPDGVIKLRPRTYGIADASALLTSPNLFARKFDLTTDPEIITLLEKHLAGLNAANYETDPSPALIVA